MKPVPRKDWLYLGDSKFSRRDQYDMGQWKCTLNSTGFVSVLMNGTR